MKGDAVHRWLTLGANLGVLVGIILLLVELDQNSTMMRAQTRNDLSTSVVELMTVLASNPQLASVRRRAEAGEELTPDEWYQYEYITRSFFRYWENVHYQYRQGLYDEVEYGSQRDTWGSVASSRPVMVSYWCEHRSEFSPQFREEFDGLLTTHTCAEVD